MLKFFDIAKDGLVLRLCKPGVYYKGTRFDWNGVFRRIEKKGMEIADEWFASADPLRHDNVCGCSEEFAPIWIDGDKCVKVGVGVLQVEGGAEQYDRFKLYPVIARGERSIDVEGDCAVFTETLDGFYEYRKVVRVTSGEDFCIEHTFVNLCMEQVRTTCYNHNFFTFGAQRVDPRRSIEFPSHPTGKWRPDSVNGYMKGNALRFRRIMFPGEKCFIGNLHTPEEAGKGYAMTVRHGEVSVDIRCDKPMDHAVFWSNDRVSCIEPYVDIRLGWGESFRWSIDYTVRG